MTTSPKIRIRGLRKSFGGQAVLAGVDLDIPEGESLALFGVSGSGKTVLMKCLLGLLPFDSGRIEFDGRNFVDMSPRDRIDFNRKIGVVFQKGALFDAMSVWENIGFGLGLDVSHTRDLRIRDTAIAMLARVALAADVADLRPAELSGGMQKRVALARAFVGSPELLFLDSPTDGLDPILTTMIDGLIVAVLQKLRATSMIITHDIASARRIAERAALLSEGRIVWEGPVAMLDNSGHPIVERYVRRARQQRAG